jgi:hypothetical protein
VSPGKLPRTDNAMQNIMVRGTIIIIGLADLTLVVGRFSVPDVDAFILEGMFMIFPSHYVFP